MHDNLHFPHPTHEALRRTVIRAFLAPGYSAFSDAGKRVAVIWGFQKAHPSERIVWRGYTKPELDAAFKKISPLNWKNPIKATILYEDFDACDAAAEFFTGAGLANLTSPRFWIAGYRCYVEGPGYYAVIGA